MAKIKLSELKQMFTEVGLDEGIFDIFRSKSSKLRKKLKGLETDVDDIVKSAPDKATAKKLRNLSNALRAYDAQSRKMGR